MRTSTFRITTILAITALSACSGGGAPSSPLPQHPSTISSSAPASASSQTRATFVVHWPSAAQAAAKRRDSISASTQSISVGVNGGPQTYVNKPTLTGSPSTTSLSIPAPAGNDSFTFTAWDEVNGTGNVLDQASTSQDILANANNTVSVTLDGVCAAIVPTLAATGVYIEYQNTTVPLASGSRTVLKSARLVGQSSKTFQFTKVDADGNTILTAAGTSPITVSESGTTPHVTIAPVSTSATNSQFNVAALVAEPDGFSTSITATSPNCGTGTPTFPNSFQLSTSAEVIVADFNNGIFAYDQDGTQLAQLAKNGNITGLAYSPKSGGYLVAVEAEPGGGVDFQSVSLTGSEIGYGAFTPHNTAGDTAAATELPHNIVYDAGTGYFYLTLGAIYSDPPNDTKVENDGAIEGYAISGSTATYEGATTYGTADPASLVALTNNDVAVNDVTGTGTYLFADSLELDNSQTVYANALSFDSTRGNIIGFPNNSTVNGVTNPDGVFFDQGLVSSGTSFNAPTPLQGLDAGILCSVYSPGNDELYMFGIAFGTGIGFAPVVGLSGSTVVQGGSTNSNLPAAAFPGLSDPQQAVVIP